jgi:lycopene cyclase domain-containing protein
MSYTMRAALQLLINGMLTGLPVVRYRSDTINGMRIAFAPIEDLAFGFALNLVTLTLWSRADSVQAS